ncbi:MAG: hypothetical protein AB7U79_01600 [Candidatus Izemoplasmatales bacterium]
MKEYKILHIHVAISFLLAALMAFYRNISMANYIYISIFVLPVILFAMLLFIEREDQTVIPKEEGDIDKNQIVFSKIVSSLTLQLIPLFFYIIVITFAYHLHFSYLLFILAFLLGSLLHILIGLTLSIISKTSGVLSFSYLTYIILFSSIPIFYSAGLIPLQFQYALLVSPAYLSGILIDDVLISSVGSSLGIAIISAVLQVIYVLLLSYFIIRPFAKNYLEDCCKK